MKNHSNSLTASPITDRSLGLIQEIIRQRRSGQLSDEQLLALTEGRNPFDLHWYDAIVRRCQSQLSTALRRSVKVPPPPDSITPALAEKLARFGMILVWFPELDINADFRVKSGKWVKPESWFYENLGPEKIDPSAVKIAAGWYAIDTTPAVDKNDHGWQEGFSNDPLTPLITRLRSENKVGKQDNVPIGSRFSITSDEWESVVAPALAQELGFKPNQVRLERAIEFNLVGNVYDKARGRFNTWQWFNDLYGSANRLLGGPRDDGGLSRVRYVARDDRRGSRVGRCLVHFS